MKRRNNRKRAASHRDIVMSIAKDTAYDHLTELDTYA